MTTITSPQHQAPQAILDFIQSGALKHVAIIMDGNRRWAQKNGVPSSNGHYQGYRALKTIVRYASDVLHLQALTVYAFSTENWQRPRPEVAFLVQLFQDTLRAELAEMMAENVRLKFLGSLDNFPALFRKECQEAERATAGNTGLIYQVALSYGGRSEIVLACQQLAKDVKNGRLTPEEITEQHIRKSLYDGASGIDPDMVIRTGGECRLSNFLLWQAAYAELVVLDELWPEFSPATFNRAIEEFMHRQRRFGK